MTRKNIILAIVAILVLAVLAWWLSSSGSQATTTESNLAATTTQSGTTHSSLRTLATQGGNYTCTVNTASASGQTRGTIYGSNSKTRLDFVIASGGLDTSFHTIRSGGYAYTWVDGQTVGTKTAISASSGIVPQPQGGVIAVSDTSELSSDCHPWSPDAKQFVPPTGIMFVAK